MWPPKPRNISGERRSRGGGMFFFVGTPLTPPHAEERPQVASRSMRRVLGVRSHPSRRALCALLRMRFEEAAVVLAAALGVCIATHATAQTVEQFYKGRTVSLIVGFNPGGAYDPYARTLARHLPNHLPGA